MRPITSFALHAIAAAVLTALAASSAAAQPEQRSHTGGRFYLDIGGGNTGYLGRAERGGTASADERHKDQIEILSWSWGETRADGKVEHEWKVEEGESAPPAPGGSAKFGAIAGAHRNADMAMKGSKIDENAPAPTGGVRVAAGDVNGDPILSKAEGGRADTVVSPRDSASGQATGKRQHKPLRMRTYADQGSAPAEKRQHGWVTVSKPLDRGAVRVKVKMPWLGCRVGARYPVITLGDGAKRYELRDAVVTGCGSASAGDALPMEEVSFNYGKIVWK